MNPLETMILRREFRYEPPYFYRHDLALRCELGIGENEEAYITTAKKRASEIYAILFEKGVDLFFFDHCIYDYDFDMGNAVNVNALIATEKARLKFCLNYQKKYGHAVVRDIPFEKEDDDRDVIQKNRICCYPDDAFHAIEAINEQIDGQETPTIHLVSFANACILSVYDDRGCDVVFFDKGAFQKFYPLLKAYFLDCDAALMQRRYADSIKKA